MRSRNAQWNDDCEIEAKRSEKMDRKREERTSETLTIFVIWRGRETWVRNTDLLDQKC